MNPIGSGRKFRDVEFVGLKLAFPGSSLCVRLNKYSQAHGTRKTHLSKGPCSAKGPLGFILVWWRCRGFNTCMATEAEVKGELFKGMRLICFARVSWPCD